MDVEGYVIIGGILFGGVPLLKVVWNSFVARKVANGEINGYESTEEEGVGYIDPY